MAGRTLCARAMSFHPGHILMERGTIMLAHEVAARITAAEQEFGAYLDILRPLDRQVFTEALNMAGERLWRGNITWEEYKGVRAELQRDAKGTAAQYRTRRDNPRRIVTVPTRRKVA